MLEILYHDAPLEGWCGVGEVDRLNWMQPASLEYAIAPDKNIYFTPALRKRQQGYDKADVLCTRVLWADIDSPKTPVSFLPPSFTVWSGHGWHLYWLLKEWCYDIAAIESANKVLTDLVGGDHCWNANRLLRLPGSFNVKTEPAVECRLVGAGPYVYPLSDVLGLSKLTKRTRHKVLTGDSRGFKSRSERDFNVLGELVDLGLSELTIEALFSVHNVGDKFRDTTTDGEKYLRHTLERVRARTRVTGELDQRDDGYYVVRGKSMRRLSTFTLNPTLLLTGDTQDALVCTVKALGYEWPGVVFSRSAFNSRANFDKECPIASWQWLGKDDDIRELLPYLIQQLELIGLPKVKATSVLGVHLHSGRHWFVGETASLCASGPADRESAPVVSLPTKREHPGLVLDSVPAEVDTVRRVGALLPRLNVATTIWPVIGWYCATPFKTAIELAGVRFPILSVFGTKGSGKTTTIQRVMLPLMVQKEPKSYDAATTRFVTLALLGSTNASPIAFSEFRYSSAEKFLRYVLLAYDTGHDPRGRADQTTVDYPLSAPFSLDGEDVPNDPAVRERILAVDFHPEYVQETSEAWQTYRQLQSLSPDGSILREVGTSYLLWCLAQMDSGQVPIRLQSCRDLLMAWHPSTLPDRIRNNLTVALMGITSFCEFFEQSMPSLDVLSHSLKNVYSPKLGRAPTLADEFAEDLINFLATRSGGIPWDVDETGTVYFQLAPAFAWWLKYRRGSGQMTLNRDAIKAQLLETGYVAPPEARNGAWMYKIDLARAHAAGLDIPAALTKRTFKVEY